MSSFLTAILASVSNATCELRDGMDGAFFAFCQQVYNDEAGCNEHGHVEYCHWVADGSGDDLSKGHCVTVDAAQAANCEMAINDHTLCSQLTPMCKWVTDDAPDTTSTTRKPITTSTTTTKKTTTTTSTTSKPTSTTTKATTTTTKATTTTTKATTTTTKATTTTTKATTTTTEATTEQSGDGRCVIKYPRDLWEDTCKKISGKSDTEFKCSLAEPCVYNKDNKECRLNPEFDHVANNVCPKLKKEACDIQEVKGLKCQWVSGSEPTETPITTSNEETTQSTEQTTVTSAALGWKCQHVDVFEKVQQCNQLATMVEYCETIGKEDCVVINNTCMLSANVAKNNDQKCGWYETEAECTNDDKCELGHEPPMHVEEY